MIEIKHASTFSWNEHEGYVFLVPENFTIQSDSEIASIEKNFYPHLASIFEKHSFKGKHEESYILTALHNSKLIHFIFIGLGSLKKGSNDAMEDIRRVIGSAVSLIKKLELKTALIKFSALDNMPFASVEELARQVSIIASLADYEFNTFKTAKEKKQVNPTLSFYFQHDNLAIEKNLHIGSIIGKSTNKARNWADLPPNILTPTKFSQEIQEMAKEHNLKCTIFGREKALELGMGGFACVDSGSDQEGKFVIVEYTPSKTAPTIALVGKGVMFDSGGISLKPSHAMSGMKYDMSGAAAVMATMNAIAQLKPDINVVAITPLVENMPSGKSYRQDDIVTFMNGKTAEIQNTDAEGRLILADALCYAEKYYSPSCIIDIATLTGACVVALGHFFTALMTRDEQLSLALLDQSIKSGERLWRLPLHDDYKASISSSIADISNCGKPSYGGGTITAALFLEHFVEKTPWAHLDIAGTGHDVPDINYLGGGATGVGVRLFVDFVMNYIK